MKMHAYVAGVGMTRFGKQMDKTLKGLAGEAITAAPADAGMDKSAIQAAWMGNAAAGVVTGQEMIRGQVALRSIGIGKIPVVNVENACASSSTAFQQACARVTAGMYDLVLACGSGPATGSASPAGAARRCRLRTDSCRRSGGRCESVAGSAPASLIGTSSPS